MEIFAPSDKVFSKIDIDEIKKKSINLIEEYDNIFTPFEQSNNEVEVPNYKSFIMLMNELGLDKIDYISRPNKTGIIDDYIEGTSEEAKYKEFVKKFNSNDKKF